MRLLLLTNNSYQISLSNTSSVAPDEEEDAYITSNFFGNILPDMTEALKMLDGETEMRDIVFDNSRLTLASEPAADCSVEGFRYLAGYIAYRGRKYDHSLGTPTEQLLHLPSDEHVGWIETLSRGGLLVPSEEWLKKISQFEVVFVSEHGKDGLSRNNNIMQTMCKKIAQKFPDVHNEIIKIYVKTRTFIRLRYLNTEMKKKKRNKADMKKAQKWIASSL
ncbi:uncharacterized protein LOC118179377 [Stegodyphus dumicola]|uniref:uncharacterized protein LOC118179377 n=1 Tax=Stegodyphus dumicola TaxID=202533 RepID=UPI0015A75EE9|nr:uncharacterized protein LOC118179377 [Stegodyphus dumicola]